MIVERVRVWLWSDKVTRTSAIMGPRVATCLTAHAHAPHHHLVHVPHVTPLSVSAFKFPCFTLHVNLK